MDHTPYIVASYIVFAVVITLDFLSPILARRRLARELRGRALRTQNRSS